MSVPPISIHNLHKSFYSGKKCFPILKGVSLEVGAGQVVGFLGANGSGKTTTLSIVADLLRPDSGTVSLLGKSPGDPGYHDGISFVAGDSEFFWLQRVHRILEFYGELHGVSKSYMEEQTALCQIDHRMNARWESLSNGERTRVRLCRALLKKPKVLLLDEPTVGLDPDIAGVVRTILAKVKAEGTAILLTSHYMKDIEELADQVYFLRAGEIVASGTPQSFTVRHNLVEVTVSDLPSEVVLPASCKVTAHHTLEIPIEELATLLPRLPVTGVRSKEDSLEEYFISVIQGSAGTAAKKPQHQEIRQ